MPGEIRLRMSMDGWREVTAHLDGLGATGQRVGRQLQAAMATPAAGARVLNSAVMEVGAGAEKMAAGAGAAGAVLSRLGPYGLAAAAALGVTAGAVTALASASAEATLKLDDLAKSADRLHLTTDQVQALSQAFADATGNAAGFEQEWQKFRTQIALVENGMTRTGKGALTKLGVTPEDLASLDTAAEKYEFLMGKILALHDVEERRAVAARLGMEGLLPVAEKYGASVDDLTANTVAAGKAIDANLIQQAKHAQNQIDELNTRIGKEGAEAAVHLSGALVVMKATWLAVTIEINKAAAAVDGFFRAWAQNSRNDAITTGSARVAELRRQLEVEKSGQGIYGGNRPDNLWARQQRIATLEREIADIQAKVDAARGTRPAPGNRSNQGGRSSASPADTPDTPDSPSGGTRSSSPPPKPPEAGWVYIPKGGPDGRGEWYWFDGTWYEQWASRGEGSTPDQADPSAGGEQGDITGVPVDQNARVENQGQIMSEAYARSLDDSRELWVSNFASFMSEGMQAAANGDLGDYLKGWAMKWLGAALDQSMRAIGNQFYDMLFPNGGGMGASGGGWGSFFADAFGGGPSIGGLNLPALGGGHGGFGSGSAWHSGGIPGFASGTSFAPGGLAWVGERGPELLNLPRGSSVTSNDKLGGLGARVTFNHQTTINAPGADAAQLAAVRQEIVDIRRNEPKRFADYMDQMRKAGFA